MSQYLMTRILDFGCGRQRHANSIGIDINPASAADVIGDLDQLPYPFADNTFDEIWCDSILEHLTDILGVMQELHRIARPGARIIIITPHYTSVDAYTDPTHKHYFSSRTFDYLTGDFAEYAYYRNTTLFHKRATRIDFWPLPRLGGIQPQRWLGAGFIANRYPVLYERFFAYILPAREIAYELEVIKGSHP